MDYKAFAGSDILTGKYRYAKEELDALVTGVNYKDNSHIVHVEDQSSVVEILSNSAILKKHLHYIEEKKRVAEAEHVMMLYCSWSLDCTHWAWDNCLVAWRGQYTRGDHHRPTIMLEAVASQDCWIWHTYFGVADSNNDINVLNQSPLFNGFKDGIAPVVPFTVNGTEYKYPYYLVDGIYPRYAMFVKTIPHPTNEKRIRFAKAHEAARKDVERTFGIIKKNGKYLENRHEKWKKPSSVRSCMRVVFFTT
uniref:uncharacterized protein LOC122591426 n=1 Tax=Erigeron canadensis TaxID=72917 RepID=UPI001CB8C83A|nr:uncharacterized protein LOC122591426 [Erigeron canadensis]